ncbi:Transmembrane protein [Plasmodiophora brassicae]
MSNFFGDVVDHTRKGKVPRVGNRIIQVLLGLINCVLFGVGTIFAALVEKSWPDVLIGVLQLILPILGWVWSIIWGILMIVDK